MCHMYTEAVQICSQAHLLPGTWTGTLLCPEAKSSLKVSMFNMASADSIKTCSCSMCWVHGPQTGQYSVDVLIQHKRTDRVSRLVSFSKTSLRHEVHHNGHVACSTDQYHSCSVDPQYEAHDAVFLCTHHMT